MLKVYHIGDSFDFYAQSIVQMLNKSIIVSDFTDYERLTFDKINSTRYFR